ncbi:MAG: nitrilase-related carbon-nitrogen hydrolase [Pseudomonadota bacterium]
MRIALWQGPSPGGDIGAAFAAIDHALAVGSAAGADFVVMPELFLPGYGQERMDADPDWPARLSAAAAHADTGLVCGLAEAGEQGTENVARVYDADGASLARYAKVQLFGARERRLFTAGTAPVSFTHAGLKIGVIICYDAEFPEVIRHHARAGADLILCPTANPEPFDTVSRFMIPAQSAQNGLSIAYANFCGEEGDVTYTGRSIITGPDGEPLAMAGLHPAILIADIPARADPRLRLLSTQLEDLVP